MLIGSFKSLKLHALVIGYKTGEMNKILKQRIHKKETVVNF